MGCFSYYCVSYRESEVVEVDVVGDVVPRFTCRSSLAVCHGEVRELLRLPFVCRDVDLVESVRPFQRIQEPLISVNSK